MPGAKPGPNFWLMASHCLVLGSTAAFIVGFDLSLVATSAAIIVGTLPLLVAFGGLMRGSTYTQLWLGIAMVFYIGAALVETIAAQAEAVSAVLLLLASALELALLLLALKHARRA